ncbi:hypothetical protein Acor_66000 [Acrocarpospora corrugata]|uniref:DUF2637 domain-containing protein n=1 Tax=Acrocarpospora corrugata TaxID=35763 RepID=A0A5M3W948_9ACTN|nr:hypothetical protein Acor_66000 [Acrocarpospora corrugata]
MLRRLAIGLAGLALAILAGAACALSFDDLRELALQGRAEPRLAYLYPAGFDALLIVALISVPLLRSGRLLVRIQVGAILLLLLAGAGAATVATATGASFDPRQAAITVALLPWIMLVIGLWLLLALVKHTQARRADLNGDNDIDELVPFDEDHSAPVSGRTIDAAGVSTNPYPVILPSVRHALPDPHISAEAAAPPDYTPPVPVSPVTETVAPPELAPPLPRTKTPSPQVEDPAPLPQADDSAADPQPKDPAPEQPTRPKRPTRWGDLIRPNVGDVLVHPRPGSPAATATPDLDDDPEATPDDPAFADYSDQSDTCPTNPAATPSRQPSSHGSEAPTQPQEAETPETPSAEEPGQTQPTQSVETSTQAQDDPDVSYWAGTADEITPTTPEETTASEYLEAREVNAQTAPDLVASDDAAAEALSRRYDEAAAQIAARFSPPAEPDENEEAGVDTQPIRQVRDSPDPEHGIDAADPEELNSTTRRLPSGAEPPAPPSGRMRSTPLPPS